MKTIQLKKFRTRLHQATDEVEIIFGEGDEAIGVKLHRAHAGRFLLGLGKQFSEVAPQGIEANANVMPIEKLGASKAEDGTLVLRISTTNLPELAFAIRPDQLESIEAWLAGVRQALRDGTMPH